MNYGTYERIRMKFSGYFRTFCLILAVSLFFVTVIDNVSPSMIHSADAARFILRVEEEVYTPGESLVIYGAGVSNDGDRTS